MRVFKIFFKAAKGPFYLKSSPIHYRFPTVQILLKGLQDAFCL